MRLEDLARQAPYAAPLAVPDWTLGAWRRRSIAYASGAEDRETQVIWLQSHGLTGDIRIPAARPDVRHRGALSECSPEELVALAHSEGGVAWTRWADGRMDWDDWAAFQPYDKWPEPGELRRVGDCLIEFAPSGVYVEDWRLQPSTSRLLAGLRLLSEAVNGEAAEHRDGGLVVAGDHAILSLGRRAPLESAPLAEQLGKASEPTALAEAIFESSTRYALRQSDGDYCVALATNPFEEGGPLPLTGFSPGEEPGEIVQLLEEGGRRLVRRWRVDTLLPDVAALATTRTTAEGADWLARQAPYLPGVDR